MKNVTEEFCVERFSAKGWSPEYVVIMTVPGEKLEISTPPRGVVLEHQQVTELLSTWLGAKHLVVHPLISPE